jgi:hypothetical protein
MALDTSDSPVWFITGRSTGFGRDGVENAGRQLRSMPNDIDRWRKTSLSADFQAA